MYATTSRKTLLSLNHDVLLVVISFLSPRDALTLTSVARHFRLIARPRSLSGVVIESSEKLGHVCKYMLADAPNRLHYLRDLELTSPALLGSRGSVHASMFPLLADFFTHAHNLRHLKLHNFENILTIEPRVGDVLVGLPKLAHLELRQAACKTLEVLGRLHSSPRTLVLDFSPRQVSHAIFFTVTVPLHSVQVLELYHLEVQNPLLDAQLSLSPQILFDDDPRWKSVLHLTIARSAVPLSLYAHAFPNVRTLCLDHHKPEHPSDNVAVWPHLERIRARSSELKHWPMTCAVHHLELASDNYRCKEEVLGEHLYAVRKTSPASLSFQIHNRVENRFWPALLRNSARLQCLQVTIGYGSESPERLLEWLECMTAPLSSSRVLALQVRVDDWRHQEWDELLLECALEELTQFVPTLRYVSLGVGQVTPDAAGDLNKYEGSILWWRVIDSGGSCSLERFPPEAGERILARLQSHGAHTPVELDALIPGKDRTRRGWAHVGRFSHAARLSLD